MKIITDENCVGYSSPGHPERPARISMTLEKLRGQKELPIEWAHPTQHNDEAILRAHTAEHVARLRIPHDFDADTPYHTHIADFARQSVAAALDALKCARNGETVFSLMRPPGHHATRDRAMGFCYLNSIAIAALEATATGTKRVAVFDFDVHHGNGTEAILLDKTGTAFFSIHQYPCYPGTGTVNVGKNCFNYPVAPRTPRDAYRKVLESALSELKKFKPELVACRPALMPMRTTLSRKKRWKLRIFIGLARNLESSACRCSACLRAVTATICRNSSWHISRG
jgi:acetoin utilization deacetylase AcuC-like enzyme